MKIPGLTGLGNKAHLNTFHERNGRKNSYITEIRIIHFLLEHALNSMQYQNWTKTCLEENTKVCEEYYILLGEYVLCKDTTDIKNDQKKNIKALKIIWLPQKILRDHRYKNYMNRFLSNSQIRLKLWFKSWKSHDSITELEQCYVSLSPKPKNLTFIALWELLEDIYISISVFLTFYNWIKW